MHSSAITTAGLPGLTEPSIIAAEPPNPLVNELIIMPDIEKRLEAFVRIAHGIVIFPGGVGTAEELLYLLGILMNPQNSDQVLPLILTGPKESADDFRVLDDFIVNTLGEAARRHYKIIIDDAAEVARLMKKAMPQVKEYRRETGDAYSFNWSIHIAPDLQVPFLPTHENMANLKLFPNQPAEKLAADLRRAFSGIVAGNVKEMGDPRNPGKRSVSAARRCRSDAPYGRTAAGLRRAAAHEAAG
ncbi:hypothetical protein E05_46330 [Plautia stali symbiont]|nr:hypothetical protein E05_46330 [Plautia stali symbiont]